MYIDTHCHISKEYYDDIDKVIEENINSNVKKMIVSGCEINSIEETLNLIKKYDSLYATIGFHPEQANIIEEDDIKKLEQDITNNIKVVGIGEIGLDYHYGKENIEKQKELFETQLKLAEKLNLPVVIHTRDATKDTIDILKKYNVKGIIHCFSGSLETAKEYIKMGFYLGIGGVVTFKNSNLYKVIEQIDIKNIVLETDSPYLTPEPYRGKKNSSKYISIISEKIASIKNVNLLEIEKRTTNNCYDIFDLEQ